VFSTRTWNLALQVSDNRKMQAAKYQMLTASPLRRVFPRIQTQWARCERVEESRRIKMAENKNRPASVVKDPVDAPLVTMQTLLMNSQNQTAPWYRGIDDARGFFIVT